MLLLSETLGAEKFGLISKVSCVRGQPEPVDNLNDMIREEKTQFCTGLQRQQFSKRSFIEEEHTEKKPGRLAENCFVITVFSQPCSDEKTQPFPCIIKSKLYPFLKTVCSKLG